MKHTVLACVSLLGLVACGDVQKAEIIKLCEARLEVSKTACKCVGERSKKELTDDERGMLIAMISDDRKKADSLRGSMPASGMMKVGMFVAMVPSECESAPEK